MLKVFVALVFAIGNNKFYMCIFSSFPPPPKKNPLGGSQAREISTGAQSRSDTRDWVNPVFAAVGFVPLAEHKDAGWLSCPLRRYCDH